MAYDRFTDARELPNGSTIDADICIVGAGAAGITLAQEFASTGQRVCCLEAGGLSVEPDVDALSSVSDIGRPYDANSKRLRYYGGTTNHWGGHCVPLEPEDFKKRDWISEDIGWPFGYDELVPHYRRAHELLGIGPFEYDANAIAATLGTDLFPFDPATVRTQVSRYNRVRFGLKFGDQLNRSENIQTYIYADVCDAVLSESNTDRVEYLNVGTVAGNRFKVKAQFFVFAAGGIENARLLLMSNQQRSAGLGNHNDKVGRYFMDHLAFHSGYINAPKQDSILPLYVSEVPFEDYAVRAHLVVPPETSKRLGISRYRTELIGTTGTYGALKRLKAGKIDIGDIFTLMTQPYAAGHAIRCRDQVQPTGYFMYNYVEQVPNSTSRVSLSDRVDALGRPQIELDWKISEVDHDCILKAQNLLAKEVGRTRFGRVKIEMETDPAVLLEGVGGGAHHMGTTRMASTAAEGVADQNGKVFHTENLYLAGSSLYPSCSYPNPTLTIVALSIRLADHLKTRLDAEVVQ